MHYFGWFLRPKLHNSVHSLFELLGRQRLLWDNKLTRIPQPPLK